MATPSESTVENLQPQIEYNFYGAVTAARAVLPAMREAGAGTLLFTTGGGSINPVPMLGNVNAAAGALRNWVLNLHNELAGAACTPRTWRSAPGSVTTAPKASPQPPPTRSHPCTGTCTSAATNPRPSSPADSRRHSGRCPRAADVVLAVGPKLPVWARYPKSAMVGGS
ncbi:SDR family NAD(P)-dependent oxidoreductase [Streptomyces sp. LUP47B]|uniref:SDR family NAD(P)-dependent oxidoreductase n=1 Tax=Streptomyces sp. LUP47B TaxID=1890286 RepID=UPI00210CF08B|nr:SDR family NAD(P)-dependent oxidoreductase [Streptomyces sp. LUP47B]